MTTMQKMLKNKQIKISGVIMVMISLLSVYGSFSPVLSVNYAQAETNLILDGSFEDVIDKNWFVWKDSASLRDYSVFRSLSVPFGTGSYSAGLEATGEAESRWQAGIVTKSKFKVELSSNYYFIFYAKADQPAALSVYLEDADSYRSITPIVEQSISSDWQRYIILLATETSSANTIDSLITLTFGDLAKGNILYLDGLQLFKSNTAVTTTEVKGYIGDKDKQISLSNIGNYNESDIQVELPYYDNQTGQMTFKKFKPKEVSSRGIKIDMYNQTFSGIGSVYINSALVGNFDYVIMPKITGISPSMVRADEDLTISGSGFYPAINIGNVLMVVKTVDITGKINSAWIKPHTINSQLSQITANLPAGVVSGQLFVHISFLNKDGNEVINKSNALSYKVKPIISDVAWSTRGYEQVGDKIIIKGKGISNRPSVNYYDESGLKLESKRATLVTIGDEEIIEAVSTKKSNSYNITVTSGGVESDIINAINFTASPKITSIKSKYSRKINDNSSLIQAGKVGEEITITGEGMKIDQIGSYIEFQGIYGRINIPFEQAVVDINAKNIKVNIPSGAQNGFVNVVINGKKSNSLPLEIVPTIVSILPESIWPGAQITILASGVGSKVDLTAVTFLLDKTTQKTIKPSSITYANNLAQIVLIAPSAISNQASKISLQYDKWQDNGMTTLSVSPMITSAGINLDNRILTIKGYGFSQVSKDNLITYKYADTDKTVINPKVKILGVYATEEGQEIRVQILDDYYYGYVTVKVGEQTSNEVNFGPVSIKNIARRVEFVKTEGKVMGVLYISGYNFGPNGGVKVGGNWATVHYRSNFFIIAVIDQSHLYDNPVVVAKE